MAYKFNPFTKKPDYYETGSSGSTIDLVNNLKPVVNVNVNKLDIFTKSGGAAPDSTNYFTVSIPDGNGYTARTRKAQYASGNSQIIMADAANYWGKGSLDAEIKTAWLYAIWDGTGIVWALAGYSGFTMVPTTTTATDDDYFLLEDGSSYSRSNDHYCVSVAKIRYQYDTADNPDHTIQATVENSPQVIWNPRSDYGYVKLLASEVNQESNIADYSVVNVVVKQSGYYIINAWCGGNGEGTYGQVALYIKTGSSTYNSATQKAMAVHYHPADYYIAIGCATSTYLNSGDTIHLGAGVNSGSATRTIYAAGKTGFTFQKID